MLWKIVWMIPHHKFLMYIIMLDQDPFRHFFSSSVWKSFTLPFQEVRNVLFDCGFFLLIGCISIQLDFDTTILFQQPSTFTLFATSIHVIQDKARFRLCIQNILFCGAKKQTTCKYKGGKIKLKEVSYHSHFPLMPTIITKHSFKSLSKRNIFCVVFRQ